MKPFSIGHAAGIAVAVSVAACSPALDWREVRLDGLQVLLPCKPDHGERTVQLASLEVRLKMNGCEADGALYAISHVRLMDSEQALVAQAAWQTAALSNMRATTVQNQSVRLRQTPMAVPPTSALGLQPLASELAMLSAEGTQSDGAKLHARLIWAASGESLYHIAVYGPKLDAAHLETLLTDIRLQ